MATARSHQTLRFVSDLLSYMTLDEKLGQLDLFHAADDPALEQAIVAGRVGGVAGGAHARRWQGLAVERSRLGIPLLLSCDLASRPHSPWAIAASWDEGLARALGGWPALHAIESGCNAVTAPRLADDGAIGASGADIAASEPHLVARLAGAFCRGAAEAGSEPRSAVLAMVRGAPDGGAGGQAATLTIAHGGAAAAIDCPSLDTAAAERIGFGGVLLAECTRLRTLLARQFATTRARSTLEAAERALAEGLIGEDEIDAVVRGVLSAKHELALFREPQRRLPSNDLETGFEGAAERVRATMVLCRNEAGLLPLSPVSDRVVVVGTPGVAAGACADALGRAGIGHTVAPGLATRRAGETWVDPAAGDHFALALTRDAARRADFALVVLEDRHFTDPPKGAGWRVPGGAILALLHALAPVESRLVALVATTEPVDLGDADQHFSAVLQCWAPTEGFEEALGDVLSGRAGPQGRMPVSAGRFAFGQGLGFGESTFGGYVLKPGGDHVAASLRVRNSGSFAARDTVQIYVRDAGGRTRLAAFRHVTLGPGEETAVHFALGLEALGTIGASARFELAPGPIEILAGKDLRRVLSARVEISPSMARAIVNRDRGFLRLAG